MNQEITSLIEELSNYSIPAHRRALLDPLIAYISEKQLHKEPVRLNFICTHNSRRSHLAQVWAQTMALFYGINNVYCYSGGTEVTAVYERVTDTLESHGFSVQQLSEGQNPVYAVKSDMTEYPVICFSKIYRDPFNPNSDFAAIMTCSAADKGCPVVLGAEAKFSITYEDPKAFDKSAEVIQKYLEKSMEIGAEMAYVFGRVKSKGNKIDFY
jgi:arsenate reductase